MNKCFGIYLNVFVNLYYKQRIHILTKITDALIQ